MAARHVTARRNGVLGGMRGSNGNQCVKHVAAKRWQQRQATAGG